MRKDMNILCDCGCGNGFQIKFRLDTDEKYVYIDTLASGFYTKQRSIRKTIKSRIQAAWFMLIGKEYRLHDVMLSKEQWKEFVKTANTIVGSS